MVTVLDIVTDAFQESSILTQTESPNNSEAQTGLKLLNRLIGSWTNSSAMQFERVTEAFSLASGTAAYTIGSGGTFDTVRPSKIVQAHVRLGTVDYNMEIVTDSIFQSINNKTTGGIPDMLNYTNEYPLATINIYPTPSTAYTLYLTSEKPLATYATTGTTVDLPSGWQDALTYNLAKRLARVYGQPADPELSVLARESKAAIALNALKNNPLQSQATGRGNRNNIYSGYGT